MAYQELIGEAWKKMRHDQRYKAADGEALESLPEKNGQVYFRGSQFINPGDVLTDSYQAGQLFIVTAVATNSLQGRAYTVATLIKVTHLVTISRIDSSVLNSFGRSVGSSRSIATDVPLVILRSKGREVQVSGRPEYQLRYSLILPGTVDVETRDRIIFQSGTQMIIAALDSSQPGLFYVLAEKA